MTAGAIMLGAWIERFSYLGILGGLVVGGLGVPIPEEAVILASGALAHQNLVRWWIALPLCLGGVLVGDCLLYLAGHRWGDRVLQGGPFRRLLSTERLERLKAAYRRRGVLIVVTARHLVGLRAAAMLGAGIVRVPFWKFLLADFLAAVPGVGLSFLLAFLLTNHIESLLAEVHRAERWLVAVVLLTAVSWLVWHRRVARRML